MNFNFFPGCFRVKCITIFFLRSVMERNQRNISSCWEFHTAYAYGVLFKSFRFNFSFVYSIVQVSRISSWSHGKSHLMPNKLVEGASQGEFFFFCISSYVIAWCKTYTRITLKIWFHYLISIQHHYSAETKKNIVKHFIIIELCVRFWFFSQQYHSIIQISCISIAICDNKKYICAAILNWNGDFI